MRTLEFLLRRSYLKGDGDPAWPAWVNGLFEDLSLVACTMPGAQHLTAGSMAAQLTPTPQVEWCHHRRC